MLELVLTGANIPAVQAERIGLVNRVVPAGTVAEAAGELAATIAAHNPDAIKMTKEIVRTTTDLPFHQAISYAKDLRVISRLRPDFAVEVRQGASAPSNPQES